MCTSCDANVATTPQPLADSRCPVTPMTLQRLRDTAIELRDRQAKNVDATMDIMDYINMNRYKGRVEAYNVIVNLLEGELARQ